MWTHEQGTRTQREQMHARADRAEKRSERHVRSVEKNEESTCGTYEDKDLVLSNELIKVELSP